MGSPHRLLISYVGLPRVLVFGYHCQEMNLVVPHKLIGSRLPSAGILFLTAFLMIVLVLTGCGSPSDGPNSSGNANANGSQARVDVSPDEVNRPSDTDIPNGADTNATLPNSIANSQLEKQTRADRDSTGLPNPDGSAGTPKPLSRPAPDDSEYWSTLTDVARETRLFKSHPQIKRVEKINDGKKTEVKIFVAGDKVVNVPGDRFPDISRVSVNDFVKAAGLQPIPTKTPTPGPVVENPEKKRRERILPGRPPR